MSIYDVPADKLLKLASEELKKFELISPPEWAKFTKTGVSKQRPPVQEDWWYIRTASILRKIILLGPIGVNKLRTYYGGKKNRGVKPAKFYKGSGNLIRKILQQLEKSELIKQTEIKGHKGRIATSKGKSLLGKISLEIMKEENIVFAKKIKIEPEKKTKKKTTKKTAKKTTKKSTNTDKPKRKPAKRKTTKKSIKSETKPETKPETKSEIKSEIKTETKPETKSEIKSETKPETKSEIKTETKIEKTTTPIVETDEKKIIKELKENIKKTEEQ